MDNILPPIVALTILIGVFAFGEIIAQTSKAVLSTTLVAAVILLIGFWTIIPKTLITDSKISDLANVLIGILIVSQGSIIDFQELINQWKTVVICLITVLLSVVAIVFVGGLILGRDMVMAGAPIYAGANVAVLIMTAALNEKGLESLAVFCVIILVTQNFIGIPIASAMLRKEAEKMVADPEKMKKYSVAANHSSSSFAKKRPLRLPELFNKPSVHLTKLGIVASIAFFLSGLTNGAVHYLVVALILGVVFTELGFLEPSSLNRTQSGSIIIILTTAIIFANLTRATPQDIVSFIFPLLVVMGIGVTVTIVVGLLIGRIINESPYLCVAMGLSCTFGFPTTMLMPTEVANAFGKTEQEIEAIKNYMLPKMITAGFVTVTVTSVIIAGVFSGMV